MGQEDLERLGTKGMKGCASPSYTEHAVGLCQRLGWELRGREKCTRLVGKCGFLQFGQSHPGNVDLLSVVLWGGSSPGPICRLPGRFVTKSSCVSDSNNEVIQGLRIPVFRNLISCVELYVL